MQFGIAVQNRPRKAKPKCEGSLRCAAPDAIFSRYQAPPMCRTGCFGPWISRPWITGGPDFAILGKKALEGMKRIVKTQAGQVVIYPASGTGACLP